MCVCVCVFRLYNVQTGKMKKCVKGSSGDEGAVIKVDPSDHLQPSSDLLLLITSSPGPSGPGGSFRLLLGHQLLGEDHLHL